MGIKKQTFRGQEVITIEGTVSAFYINEIPADQIKTYGDKGWTPTHRYTVVVDGIRIGLGMGDKDGVSDRQIIQAKDNDGNWHAITKGVKVDIEVTEGKEYKGVMQYNSAPAKVLILDASGAQATSQAPKSTAGGTSSAQPFKPKDMSGVEAGQSLNGAMNFILTYGLEPSNENIVNYGKMVHKATVKVKSAYKEANPSVPEYDAGARCGLAVLTACKLVGVEQDFEKGVVQLAQEILSEVLEPITEFVKSPITTPPPAVKTARAVPAKTAGSKAKPVPKVEEPVVEEEDPLGGDPEFEDAPF